MARGTPGVRWQTPQAGGPLEDATIPSNTDAPKRDTLPKSISPTLSSATSTGREHQLWVPFSFTRDFLEHGGTRPHPPTSSYSPGRDSLGRTSDAATPPTVPSSWKSPSPPSFLAWTPQPPALKPQLRQPHIMGHRAKGEMNEATHGRW